MRILILTLVFVMAASFCMAAQKVVINPDNLSTADAQALVELQRKAEKGNSIIPGLPNDPQELKEWAGLGPAVAKTIKEVCKELSIEVNNFVNTEVGKMTMFLIVWHLIIKDLIGLGAATILWIVIMSLVIWSYKRNHLPERVVDKQSGEVTYIPRRVWESKDAKSGSVALHIFMVISVSILWIIVACTL